MPHIAPFLEALDKDAWDTVNGASEVFTGKYGQEQLLLGAGDSLIEAINIGMSFPKDNTISLNCKVDSIGNGDDIIDYTDFGSRGFYLRKISAGVYHARYTGSNVAYYGEMVIDAALIEDGQDNRLAFSTRWGPGQADEWEFYKNGVLQSLIGVNEGTLTNAGWEANPTNRIFTLGSASFVGKAYRPKAYFSNEGGGGGFLTADALHEYQEGLILPPAVSVAEVVALNLACAIRPELSIVDTPAEPFSLGSVLADPDNAAPITERQRRLLNVYKVVDPTMDLADIPLERFNFGDVIRDILLSSGRVEVINERQKGVLDKIGTYDPAFSINGDTNEPILLGTVLQNLLTR